MNLEFKDHKQKNVKFTKFILIFFSIFSLAIFIPVVYSMIAEEGIEPIFLFVFIPVFFSFSLLPLLLIKLTLGKPKRTIFDITSKKIQFFEDKNLLKEVPFSQIQNLAQSRYTYVVRSKNSSRTVIVYTVISKDLPDLILAESTDLYTARSFAENIAKTLKLPLTNEQGETRDHTELDIPFHKRPHANFDEFHIPNFPIESAITWTDTGKEYLINSVYKPKIFLILGTVFSIVLFLILNLAFADAFDMSVFSWESFPPPLPESIFFIIMTSISFFPIGFVLFHRMKKKEIVINSEGVRKGKDLISFNELEEIISEDNALLLIGDHSQLKVSLYMFCDSGYYQSLKDAVIYGILTKARRGGAESFTHFKTEF
ncbi:MAG: hypothetical protein SH817_13375 [Leptospira sp.]|nr:hypothetical protein [Leptospira sp.]